MKIFKKFRQWLLPSERQLDTRKIQEKRETKTPRSSPDLIRFFRNEEADCKGRMLYDILQFTPWELEKYHDFIQWIFPTREKSKFHVEAPTIDDTFREQFQKDSMAKCNFCKSCQLYLNYIGFQCRDGNLVRHPDPYMYYELPCHNLLRITRVLNSLNQIGNMTCSKRLYQLLLKEVREKRQTSELFQYKVPDTTLHYWRLTQREEISSVREEISSVLCLAGIIAGDMIGSAFECFPEKNVHFPLFSDRSGFTDDTVMTMANATWLLTGDSLVSIMQDHGRRYPFAGYGGMFRKWLDSSTPEPYNSFGNGSAMRVGPVGWAFDTLEKTLEMAKRSAEVTHNHPEGIKGAQATAACIYLARTGKSKQEIKSYVEHTFGYNLDRTCEEIRPKYRFDVTCQGSVPESIIVFLESTDFESAIRLVVSLGGDTDTMGAITGGIAEAYYGKIPEHIYSEVLKRLPDEFFDTLRQFNEKFIPGS